MKKTQRETLHCCCWGKFLWGCRDKLWAVSLSACYSNHTHVSGGEGTRARKPSKLNRIEIKLRNCHIDPPPPPPSPQCSCAWASVPNPLVPGFITGPAGMDLISRICSYRPQVHLIHSGDKRAAVSSSTTETCQSDPIFSLHIRRSNTLHCLPDVLDDS